MENNAEFPSRESADGEKLIDLFHRARQLPAEERAAFLAQACGLNEELRRELESLLEHADSDLPTSGLKLVARQLADEGRPDVTGQQIQQYRLLSMLGEGGMGKVYLAEDDRLSRRVALKFLPESFLADAHQLRRFEQEARAASALNHPNIVTVYEIGQHEGTPYIAYELVEGETLRQRLRNGPLSWQEAVAISAQIAAALKAAHSAGIIHRDIKPENVMLRADGLVKVLDFGIAKRFDLPTIERQNSPETILASTTQTGQILGTPGYLSPEQIRGEEIDAGTDIFSLGVVLYEMLVGHPYAQLAPQAKLDTAIRAEELPSISEQRKDLPASLDAIIAKATRKSRLQRFASAGEMLDALNELRPPTQTKLEEHARTQTQQRANQLLNQAVALYATDKNIRLSPAALWRIWRYSTVKRGRLESALLRRSYLGALVKAGLIALATGLMTVIIAAWYSVEEKWEGRVLRDGHSKAARRAAFSPDGKRLATYGDDGKIIIWDFAKRQQLSTIAAPDSSYYSLAFSPDGRWLAHSDRQDIVIRDAENPQKIITRLREHPGVVGALRFSPDSKLLASSAFSDERAVIWAVEGWRKLRDFSGPGGFLGLLFCADSRRLVANDRIFDIGSGKSKMIGRDSARAISPDNRLTIHIGMLGHIILFDLERQQPIKTERTHQFFVRAAAFSNDGRLAVTGAEDIALWDVAAHRVIARMEHSDNVWDLLFSPDDRWLISTHGDGSILVWDMEQRKRAADLAGHSDKVVSVVYSPSGNRVASASADQSVNIWNVTRGLKEVAFTDFPTSLNPNSSVPVIFLDEETILTNDFDNHISWRSVNPSQEPPVPPSPFLGSGTLSISPDKRWVICDTTVYDWQAQRVVFDFKPIVRDTVESIVFSPNGRWVIFTTAYDKRMFRCEAGVWQIVEQIKLSDLRPIRSAFTPDGQRLITGCYNGEIALWDVVPLRLNRVLRAHADHVQAIDVSPDGTQAVSTSDDRSIAWWDLVHGELIYRQVQSAPILSVDYSPDGCQVVAAGHDKSVRIYTRQRSLWGKKLEESNWLVRLLR